MNESNEKLYNLVMNTMEIQDNQSILEIGFGNGNFFDKLFSKAKNLKISGIDYSETMVSVAEKRNEAHVNSGDLDLWLGDCEVLPFDSDSFDKVFCINVIYFWESPTDNLMEIHRVLKPGGKFYTGIRHKDIMKTMPFTQYGFKMYDIDSWKAELTGSLFKFEEVRSLDEPAIEYEGQSYIPVALCFVAQKPLSHE